MKRVITAVVLVPLVLLLVFLGPFWLITLVCWLVAELALWEFFSLADATGARIPRLAVAIVTALLFLTILRSPDLLEALIGAIVLALFIICAFRSPLPRVLADTGFSVFGTLYIGLSMASIALLSQKEDGPSLLVFLLLAVWVGDSAALYVGRTWGRRKLAPTISPGKTREGAIASMAGSIIITALLLWLAAALNSRSINTLIFPGPFWRWIILAIVVNVAAQVGDLVESALKRGAGVKDSGSLLPGHGGVLDRIDALLIAAPVLWYILLVQQVF